MKQYGLIGYPLTHSFSKRFFTEKFERENIDAIYTNFEITDIAKLPEVIADNRELAGLNVTIPYKEQVLSFLHEIDKAAETIGAVNTIKISRKNNRLNLKGYNTDTCGFEDSLKPLLKKYHKKALILGTGGASKAIRFVLEKLKIEYLSVSRKELKTNGVRYENVDRQLMSEHLLIINTTPLGTYPQTETFPPIPYEFVTNRHLLFDLVYNPETTKFMEKGKEKGAIVKNGYEMLLGQALRSYDIWQL